jgi:hypothetical protein
MSASVIHLRRDHLVRAPGRERVPDHDARLWMVADECLALRLEELDHAGRRALCAKVAQCPGGARAVLNTIAGDGGGRC